MSINSNEPAIIARPLNGLAFVAASDRERVSKALTSANLRVHHAVDLEQLPRIPLDVVVVDPDVLGTEPLEALSTLSKRLGDASIVLLCGPQSRTRLIDLLAVPMLVAVTPRDHAHSDAELCSTLALVAGGPQFGLSHFVPEGAARFTETIACSDGKQALLDRLADFAAAQGVRRRLIGLAVDAAEELITNALYDAPTDESGNRIYAELDRRHAVFLSEKRRPTLRAAIGCDSLFFSVSDPNGSLSTSTVKRYLVKGLDVGAQQIDDKQGGAGLGFARIFAMVDRMVVQVAADSRSEVSLCLSLKGARRNMATRPTGLVLCSQT